jgi:transcription-repair coupling factor (superfamily II helicase)
MRLVHYKRIANAGSERELEELQIELIDRFGLLPAPAKTLFSITSLKLIAQRLGITKIQAGPQGGTVRFGERSTVDPLAILALIEHQGDTYRLEGPFKLRYTARAETPEQRMATVQALLAMLGADERTSAAA